MKSFSEEKYVNAQNTLNSITPRLGCDSESWLHFIAILIQNGRLTEDSLKQASELIEKREAAKAAKAAKIAAEREAQQAAFNDPEVAYPRLFNRRSANIGELDRWFNKTSLVELEKLLQKLKSNPFHWKSLYNKNGLSDAILRLENEIMQRKK